MPLKLTTNGRGEVKLTWTAIGEEMEASWKLKSSDDEDKILEVLTKAVRFIRVQRGEQLAAEKNLEAEIYAPMNPEPEVPADAPRIVMGPPSAVGDRPSDGGPPPISTFNWKDMPTGNIPTEVANREYAPGKSYGWEMIPESER
jgi:hypothetical protein